MEEIYGQDEPLDILSNADKNGEWRTKKINLWAVFKSFISQIKIGQDLTKISLPAELCFPYSMLEVMGSRKLSLFHFISNINKHEAAYDRFLVMIKYVLAILRQEKSEKKPWNPILGETHIGFSDHNDSNIAFISEQVSHHPPISAFSVINEEDGLVFDANISFAVKFGGNSVTVSTKGEGRLHAKRFDEEYVMSRCIPDMLVKHVVWGKKYIIWTGECKISCPTTGYHCTLEFKEGKGKKNLVSGDIYLNDDIICRIEGDCDGESFLVKDGKKESFFQFDGHTPATPKYLPKELLDLTSSVVVWGKPNEGIIEGDLVKADKEKFVVENEQRVIRREREENKEEFKAKYFEENEDNVWRLKKEVDPYAILKGVSEAMENLEIREEKEE